MATKQEQMVLVVPDSKKFTPKEKQDYYNAKARKGAAWQNPKTGEMIPVSDFARGYAKGRADSIFNIRKSYAKKFGKKKTK